MMNLDIQYLVTLVPVLLLAFTIHEYAHAWVANRFGDDTAAQEGRLSFNPLVHLDVLGTLVLLTTGLFGWAKPVPVNPSNFKNPVKDMALVAVAGPTSNIILAVLFSIIFKIMITVNIFYSLPQTISEPLSAMLQLGIVVNIGLAFFNMLPIPPLDGFNVISYFLKAQTIQFMQQYQMIFFAGFLLLIFTGIIQKVLGFFIYGILSFLFMFL